MTIISSSSNENFRRWRSLDQSRGIRKAGEFLLMGEKLIAEFLRSGPEQRRRFPVRGLITALDSPRAPIAADDRIPIYLLPQHLFAELDVIGTKSELLILELPQIKNINPHLTPPKGIEVVCPAGDPGNLGAVLRCAQAFQVSQVILTEESCLPFHPKAVKASAGACLSLEYAIGPSIKNWIPQSTDWALDLNGQSLLQFSAPKNLRLLCGEEGLGLPQDLGLQKLHIPTNGVESLNVAVSAGIALFELRKQLT